MVCEPGTDELKCDRMRHGEIGDLLFGQVCTVSVFSLLDMYKVKESI